MFSHKALKFSIFGALIIILITLFTLIASGHESELTRYFIPLLVGASAGFLIGAWKERNERLLAEKSDLLTKFQTELVDGKHKVSEIRQSEEQIRLLLTHTAEGIYGLDCQGKCTFCNPSFLKILGYSDEKELLGEKVHELIHHTHPDGSPYPASECKAHKGFLEGLEVHIDNEVFWKKDGSAVHVEYWSHPIFKNNKVTGAVITVINISKTYTALKALHESQERYRSLVQTAHDAIVSINKFGEIIFWNDSAERVFGYTKEQIVGQNVTKIIPKRDRAAHKKALKKLTDSGQSELIGRSIELIGLKKDNTKFPVELSLSSWEREGIMCFTSIIRDISKRKKTEKEKEKLANRLQRAQKMEAIGLMAGGVAHDLNNILSGIVSYPELILMRLPEDSKIRPAIETILESGLRASEVVADLLTVARGVASTKRIANLNKLIHEYLDSPEGQKLKEQNPTITITTNLEKELFNILCSTVHIKKCLMNLMNNASESIDREGRIIISTRNQSIDKDIAKDKFIKKGEYVVLAITDTGFGISSNDMDRIFEPFYTKKIMGRSGTGLGLAIVWNTVKDHGGGVSVESDENGTTFELYFPSTKKDFIIEKSDTQINDLKGKGEKILIVDDEPLLLEIVSQMLESLNYNVKTVESGEKAIEYLNNHSVNLVVLDMVMAPGMNGHEAYEQIIKIHPGQKAIIVSGFSETDEVEKARALGAHTFVKKPFSIEQIGRAVQEALI